MRAILIVDHGSRVAAASTQLEELARLLAREVPEALVAHAHLELAAPSIGEAIDALAAAGATELVVSPCFLGPGRHAGEDVPRLAREAAARHALPLRIAEPLGAHELLAKLLLVRVEQARSR